MWIIAGLGNPGKRYAKTRHNIGFLVVEEIARRYAIDFKEREKYRIGKGSIDGIDVLLVEPLLYMNNSGVVVKDISNRFNIPPENMIVIHDDLDMEMGKVRIRRKGSTGGHKGVESIIQNLSAKVFTRLKIGIGRESDIAPEDYVLSKFRKKPLDTAVHPRGGAWSTYYYNNFIYESDTTRGLRVYRVSDRVTAGALRLRYLNPQTQDFSVP